MGAAGAGRGSFGLTGVGLVCAAGSDADALLRAMRDGAPSPAGRLGPPAAAGAGEIPIAGFDVREHVGRRGLGDLSRTSQLACAAAARLAAGLRGLSPTSVGVVLGTAWGSLQSVVAFEEEARTEPARFLNPLLFAETVANVPAGQVAIVFGWSAFNATVSAGAAAGLEAVRQSIVLLEEGRAGAAVCGGADECNASLLGAFRAAGRAGGDGAPYGRGRRGPAAGEGACLLVVEEEGAARARGARLLARVRTADSATAATDGDLVRFIESLLEAASLSATALDVVLPAADGSREGDRLEASALARLFGAPPHAPPLALPQAALGQTWAASGPLGVAAAVAMMERGFVPPFPRAGGLDPELPPLHLPASALRRPVRRALVLSRSGPTVSGLVLEAAGETHGS